MKYTYESENQRRMREAMEAYEANPKFCPFCGTKIAYERRHAKFCDQSCSAKFNNRGVARVPKKITYCECGKLKSRKNKYCSECAEKHIYNRVTSLEEAKYDRMRKRVLLEERGHRCEDCGFEEWKGKPIPLELDHIDGNSDNNAAENLRLICPNCHAQTETYKGANAGKNSSRQIMRRKRYANGQTY